MAQNSHWHPVTQRRGVTRTDQGRDKQSNKAEPARPANCRPVAPAGVSHRIEDAAGGRHSFRVSMSGDVSRTVTACLGGSD